MLGVYIGRFQPFHSGHAQVAQKALKECDALLFLIGVPLISNIWNNPCLKNPFMSYDVESVILDSFTKRYTHKIKLQLLFDNHSDELWREDVRRIIRMSEPDPTKVALYGGHKDESSSYLSWFPEFEDRTVKDVVSEVSGTKIRELLYTDQPIPSSYFATRKAQNNVLRLSRGSGFLLRKEYFHKLQKQKGKL